MKLYKLYQINEINIYLYTFKVYIKIFYIIKKSYNIKFFS